MDARKDPSSAIEHQKAGLIPIAMFAVTTSMIGPGSEAVDIIHAQN